MPLECDTNPVNKRRHEPCHSTTRDYEVTVFDNFSNSKIISPLIVNGARIVKGDITKFQDVSEAIKTHDVVVHLATKISEESIKNPSETFHVNVDGTKNVLAACERHQVRKLIVACCVLIIIASFY